MNKNRRQRVILGGKEGEGIVEAKVPIELLQIVIFLYIYLNTAPSFFRLLS